MLRFLNFKWRKYRATKKDLTTRGEKLMLKKISYIIRAPEIPEALNVNDSEFAKAAAAAMFEFLSV